MVHNKISNIICESIISKTGGCMLDANNIVWKITEGKWHGKRSVWASDVYEAAKAFVEKRIAVEKMSDYTIERAKKVMDDKRNHTLAQIEEAEEILAKVKVNDDELPF